MSAVIAMPHQVNIYPHNDLLNLAHYHYETINRKVNESIEDAVALDCMSCIMALAFSVEALINFVGSKRVPDWKERRPFLEKIKAVTSTLGMAYDETVEPHLTVATLKQIRDQIAHGQPIEKTARVSSKADLKAAMETSWDSYLTPAFCNRAYMRVNDFESQLLERSGIPIESTITSAFAQNA